MSLQVCCCGDECTSDYRKFAPCDPNLSTTPIVILKTKFDECGFGSGVYSLTSNPICSDKYCGTWVCDNSITDDSDFCTNGNPTPCDCSTADVYYLLRPSDNPCTLFTLLSYIDELKDGTCCDIRCPERLSGCDSGPASSCASGERVFGCTCTDADDLTWNMDITWAPSSDNGSQRSNRDYISTSGLVFDEYDSNVAMNLTGAQTSLLSVVNCPDGTPKEYKFKVVLNWTGSVTQPTFPGYDDDNGTYGYVCKDANNNETRIQSYAINENWSTTFGLSLGVNPTTAAPAFLAWSSVDPSDYVTSGSPSFTCFGGNGSGTARGMAFVADAFSDFGGSSNTVTGPSGISPEDNAYTNGPRVCAGSEDTMFLSKTMTMGFPGLQLDNGGYGFGTIANPVGSYTAGELRIRLSLAVPTIPANCP